MTDRNQPKKSSYFIQEEFFHLLDLRFGESNRLMIKQLTEEAQRFNARGMSPEERQKRHCEAQKRYTAKFKGKRPNE